MTERNQAFELSDEEFAEFIKNEADYIYAIILALDYFRFNFNEDGKVNMYETKTYQVLNTLMQRLRAEYQIQGRIMDSFVISKILEAYPKYYS
ncbi:MAG: hypothetical protein UX04_C0006G0026 [Microgenomates group bacterium GW2011_GWF2_45_18]|nr:MAG: hypothetical protein UW18_C0006G0026 [Microgenomates group bacterium GW2011_GWF1_44_10]KKU01491.1 MAG: hypothetical protein UX04_C0006G0026 [Microgenomates group bacterium GW2011_GWF2_45_18]OGJ40577.1 MAG: hypothetical protein A2378_01830 [Candidatus Pacebacteria bacterium RIFOXYB1_FULL_44_10]HAU99400.1 hypothetical protein [Candidatus Paceibacterota bacterium]HAX01595.1 hypothetical protein [Candidatus Paceibacterota bacterium]